MNNLVNAVFNALNAVAVENNNDQPWLNDKAVFLSELASVFERGVCSTQVGWFWTTETVLSNTDILMMDEFENIVNAYDGRLNFALFLRSEIFTRCLNTKNYNDFAKFHNYFWYQIACLARDS